MVQCQVCCDEDSICGLSCKKYAGCTECVTLRPEDPRTGHDELSIDELTSRAKRQRLEESGKNRNDVCKRLASDLRNAFATIGTTPWCSRTCGTKTRRPRLHEPCLGAQIPTSWLSTQKLTFRRQTIYVCGAVAPGTCHLKVSTSDLRSAFATIGTTPWCSRARGAKTRRPRVRRCRRQTKKQQARAGRRSSALRSRNTLPNGFLAFGRLHARNSHWLGHEPRLGDARRPGSCRVVQQ